MSRLLNRTGRAGAFLRNNWLMLLIILQPLLDIIAFWTRSPEGTFAGVVRLLIMMALPLWLLFTLPEKKQRVKLLVCLCAIGVVCLLHLMNVMRLGPASLTYEISYTAKTAQMPPCSPARRLTAFL